jgi:hypothetical protein
MTVKLGKGSIIGLLDTVAWIARNNVKLADASAYRTHD